MVERLRSISKNRAITEGYNDASIGELRMISVGAESAGLYDYSCVLKIIDMFEPSIDRKKSLSVRGRVFLYC